MPTGLRPYRFGAHPRQQQAREVAVGKFVSTSGNHVERERAVDALVFFLLAGVGARQTAQREQSRHETEIGVCLARADELRHLVEHGEVVPCLERGEAGGQDATAGQFDTSGHFTERHEPADRSRRCTHRSTIMIGATVFQSVTHKGRRMIRETIVDGETVLGVDSGEDVSARRALVLVTGV